MASVTVTEGKLRGRKTETEKGFQYYEFLGVPYAKPPVGDLRFKNPQAPEKWDNERDATVAHAENISCQVNFLNGQVDGSEDCLYLNVYTPKLFEHGSELLPVIINVHGGGFIGGNGIIKDDHIPDYLVEKNVVVVTINYRLGVLGFLSLDIPEATGNMGIKDIRKALEWIQNNIQNFCGDKNNVTITGISAGSAAIDYLILSPSAKGLFHKAILRSGSALNHWAINFEVTKLSIKLAESLGYKGSSDDRRAIYDFLLSIPTVQLIGAAFKTSEESVTDRTFFGFVPTVEKDFGNGEAILTTNPYKLLKEGNFNKVPVIRGFCNREGSLMSMMKPNAMKAFIENKNFVNYWAYKFESSDSNNYNTQLSAAYLENIKPDDEHDKMAVDFFGDLDFSAGIWIGGKLSNKNNVSVYMYQFCYDGKLNAFKFRFGLMKKGALHGDDDTYLFGNKGLISDDERDIRIRDTMTKMFTDFAKTGEPTPASAPVNWPAYSEASPAFLNIDRDITVKSNYEPKKMAIFETIYDKYGK